MLQSVLDFEFLLHLTKKIEFFKCLLDDHFECNWLLRLTLNSAEDFAEFSRSNRMYRVEIIDGPGSLGLLLLLLLVGM